MLVSSNNSSNFSINTLATSSVDYQQLQIQNNSNNNQNSNSNEKMRSDLNNQYLQTINSSAYMVNNMVNNCYSVTNVIQPNNSESSAIKMELDDKELWARFYNLTNEMILTKAGRRTFPLIKIKLTGLEESALYTVQIEFRLSDTFKYRFVNGEWKTSPRNENFKNSQQTIIYEHSDSPNFGHHWSKDSVAFSKLKLTNNENSKNVDAVFLRSLNKYDPVIHIYKHDKKNVDDKVLLFSKFFRETQFIAVTAYQNEQITNLKIKHNPFAKAFLNNKPIITVENDKVYLSEPSIKTKEQPESQPSAPVLQKPIQNQVMSKLPLQQNIYQSNTTNFMAQNLITPKIEPSQDLIQNWYNYYQNQTSPNQQQYHYNNQTIYQTQSYDSFSYTNNSVYNPYRAYTNEFIYQQNHYNQFYPQNHQLKIDNNYQQEQYNSNLYYHSQNDYNTSESSELLQTDRSKQSSPIYESYSLNTSSNKRSSSTMLKDNRSAPYCTARPAKRQAIQSNDLSVSPVYNPNFLKPEYGEQSDDSLNSSENYLSQLHNQTIQSASSASSSSFTLSSSTASA